MLGVSAVRSSASVEGGSLFFHGVDPAAFYLRRPPVLLSRRTLRFRNRLLSKRLAQRGRSITKADSDLSILRSLLLMAGVDVTSPSANLLLRLVSLGRVSDRSLAVVRRKVAHRLWCRGMGVNHAPAASRFAPKGAPLSRNLIKIRLIMVAISLIKL